MAQINIEKFALRTFWFYAIFMFLTSFFFIRSSGYQSVPGKVIVLTLLSSIIITVISAYIYGYFYSKNAFIKKPKRNSVGSILKKNGLEFFGTFVAYVSLSTIVAVVAIYIIGKSFLGLRLDPFSTAGIVALGCGAFSYYTIKISRTIDDIKVLNLVSIFMLSGVILAMLTTQDKDWWQLHFSSLGMTNSFSGAVFNITLIFSGLLIITLSSYLVNNISKRIKKGKTLSIENEKLLRILFIVFGLALGSVGLFSYDISSTIHNLAAMSTALSFCLIVLTVRYLVANLSKEFIFTSASIMGGIFGSFILYNRVQYFNLTAFELISFALILTWIFLLSNEARA